MPSTPGIHPWVSRFLWTVSLTLVLAIVVQSHQRHGTTVSLRQEAVHDSTTTCSVSKFVLWDATTNQPLDAHVRLQLGHEAALCVGDVPTKVNIEAVLSMHSMCDNATVVFDLLGTPTRHRTEYQAPYMLAGHRESHVFAMNLPVGVYALSAVPNGHLDGRREISFRVFDC